MQICDCLVLIGGDIRNSVIKKNVTAAEVAVLRQIHGTDAVRDIKVIGKEVVNQDELREQLLLRYKNVVTELFGRFGELPETLQAARVEDDLIIADATKKSSPFKKSKTSETLVSIGD